ncbi:hypothetical protein [Corynebacterium rouxii]|uniref:Immunity-specific protein n=1 Tax=Corynebacterium rouxii TaxID=2719119 RepID=A0A6I8MC68_9CORY|nr:hypothetical protein [Corynebacterium rouxii]MDT9411303.1 hypothetical protein [Corynebacterium rouxii]VZH85304.1 hypothetical protein FRC0190_01271 [Corynebacterium rouxii]
MVFDWESHRKHREQVQKDHGVWVGLLDENGVPICDFPPMEKLTAPATRMNPESCEGVFLTSAHGVVHQVVDELVADGLGVTDKEGRLVPSNGATRFMAVECPGIRRRVYQVRFVKASGGEDSPSRLAVHGTDMLTSLMFLPCWSIPGQVSAEFTRAVGDFGKQFSRPRYLAKLKMAAVADGFTVDGPAESTIRDLIKDSLAATYKAFGISDWPVQVSTRSSGKPSPRVLIRPTDQSIWDEISGPAAMSGCVVVAFMWLPGDKMPQGLSLSQPTIVVEVIQQ